MPLNDKLRRPSVTLSNNGVGNPLITQRQLNTALAAQRPQQPTGGVVAPTGIPTANPLMAPGAQMTPTGLQVDWTGYKSALGDAYSTASTFTKKELISDFVKREAERLKLSAEDSKVLESRLLDVEKDTFKEARESGLLRSAAGAAVDATGQLLSGVGGMADYVQNKVTGDTEMNWLTQAGRSVSDFARDSVISPAMQDNLKRSQELISEGRVSDAIGFLGSNPSTIGYLGLTSLAPTLIPVGGALAGARAASWAVTRGLKLATPKAALDTAARAASLSTDAGKAVRVTDLAQAAATAQKAIRRAKWAGAATGVGVTSFPLDMGLLMADMEERGIPITESNIRDAEKISLVTSGLNVVGLPLGTVQSAIIRSMLTRGAAKEITAQTAERITEAAVKTSLLRGTLRATGSGTLAVVKGVAPEAIIEGTQELLQAAFLSSLDKETGEADWNKVDWDEAAAAAAVGAVVGGVTGGGVNLALRRRGGTPQSDPTSAASTTAPTPTPPEPGFEGRAGYPDPRELFEQRDKTGEPTSVDTSWKEVLGPDAAAVEQMLLKEVIATARVAGSNAPPGLDARDQALWAIRQLETRQRIAGDSFPESEAELLNRLRNYSSRVDSMVAQRLQEGANWVYGDGGQAAIPTRAPRETRTPTDTVAPVDDLQEGTSFPRLAGPETPLALPAPVYLLPSGDSRIFVDSEGNALSTDQLRNQERMDQVLGITPDIRRLLQSKLAELNEQMGNTAIDNNEPFIIDQDGTSVLVSPEGDILPASAARLLVREADLNYLSPETRRSIEQHENRIMEELNNPSDPDAPVAIEGEMGGRLLVDNLGQEIPFRDAYNAINNRLLADLPAREREAIMAHQRRLDEQVARMDMTNREVPLIDYDSEIWVTSQGEAGRRNDMQTYLNELDEKGLSADIRNILQQGQGPATELSSEQALAARTRQMEDIVYFSDMGLNAPRELRPDSFNTETVRDAIASVDIPNLNPKDNRSITAVRNAQRTAIDRALKAANRERVTGRVEQDVDGVVEVVEIDETPMMVREDISRLESMREVLRGSRPKPSPDNPLISGNLAGEGLMRPKTDGSAEGVTAHWDSRSFNDIIPMDTIMRDGTSYNIYETDRILEWLRTNIPNSDPLRPTLDWLSNLTDVKPLVFVSDRQLSVKDHRSPGSAPQNIEGVYDVRTGQIFLNGVGKMQPTTYLHEMVHAATHYALAFPERLTPPQKAAYDRIKYMYEYQVRKDSLRHSNGDKHNALSNIAEFVAEAMSNERIRAEIDRTPDRQNMSGLRKFWDALKQMLFGKKDVYPEQYASLDQLLEDVKTLSEARPTDLDNVTISAMHYRPEVPSVTSYIARDRKTGEQRGSAILDPDTNLWTLQWDGVDGSTHYLADIPEDSLQVTMDTLGLRGDVRSKSSTPENHAEMNIDMARTYDPRVAKVTTGMEGLFGKNFTAKVLDASRSLSTSFVTRFEPILRMQNHLNNTYGTQYDVANKMIQEYARGRANVSRQGMTNDPSLFDLKEATNGLLKQHNLDADMFSNYLYAVAAGRVDAELRNRPDPLTGLDRVDRTTGFSYIDKQGNTVDDPDGSKFLMTLTDEEKAIFEASAEPIRKANRMVLEAELASGLISESEFYALADFREYVPMRNAEEQNLMAMMHREGRYSKADDPFTMMVALLDARMTRVSHNNALGFLYDMLIDHPMPQFAEVNAQEFSDTKEGWRNSDSFGRNSAYYYRGGNRYQIKANDAQLQKVFRRGEMNRFLSTLSNMTQAFSMVRTQLNPVFLFKTVTQWDAMTSIANAQGAFQGAVTDAEAGSLSMNIVRNAVAGSREIFKSNITGTDDFRVKAYHAFGGGIQIGSRAGFEQAAAKLKQQGAIRPNNPFDLLKSTAANALTKINQASHSTEDMWRYGAFISYLEMRHGGPFANEAQLVDFVRANPDHLTSAVMGSKNIITNFEVKGTNQGIRAAFAFFNAAMQGTFSTLPQIIGSAHGRKMMAILMATSMLMFQGVMDDMGEDDDGKSKAFRLRDFGKKLYITPDFGIELIHELRWANVIGQSMMGVMYDELSVPEAAMRTASVLLDATNPVNTGPSNDFGLQLATALTPSVMQFVIPLATERDAFGRPLRAEYVYDPVTGKRIERPANYESGVPQDSQWAKSVTEWLATNTSGAVDILPSSLENSVRHILGANYDNARGVIREMDGNGTDAVTAMLGTLTKSLNVKYDEFAIQNDYRELEGKWMAAARRSMQANGGAIDMLSSSGQQVAKVSQEIERANAELKNLQIDGMGAKELFQMRTEARQAGEIDGLTRVNELLERYYASRRRIMGQALVKIEALEKENQ